MDRKTTALDDFFLQPVRLLPNNGMEIEVYVSENVIYMLRVDSRGGRATVSWNGLSLFDNGRCNPLK